MFFHIANFCVKKKSFRYNKLRKKTEGRTFSMKKTVYWQVMLVLQILCLLIPSMSEAAVVNGGELSQVDFWENRTNPAIVLSAGEIADFNRGIRKTSAGMVDLRSYPMVKKGKDIKALLTASSIFPKEACKENGELFSEKDKALVFAEMDTEHFKNMEKVKRGVVVRHSNLRTLPLSSPLAEKGDSIEFDLLQETAVDPSEPVVVLHTSRSGAFYYVQMYNYRGWMLATDVAIVQEDRVWKKYIQPRALLVVTDKNYTLKDDQEDVFYQMGSRLPIKERNQSGYEVFVPRRTESGTLQEEQHLLPEDPAYQDGFLPYTRKNIVQQAFRYAGEPYGWGGLQQSVDCSSFIANIYRSVGIFLPRNADEQEAGVARKTVLNKLGERKIYSLLHQKALPGDALYMDGHVMLYLGEIDGIPYAIHALGSYTEDAAGNPVKQRVMQVVVSDLSLHRGNGNSFAASLTSLVSFSGK